MTMSKTLKAFTGSLALGVSLLSLPTTAHAQIPVTDVASIGQDAANFLQTATHYGSQVVHYAEQIRKYQEQIDSLQREYDSITGIKFSDILDPGIQGAAQRVRLKHALAGTGSTFGLGLPDTPTADMRDYHERYRMLKPEELHPENEELQRQVRELHQTLYAVDSVTGETRLAREQRLEVYDELAAKSMSAIDMKGALEVNNALLLENGRNLALLIELQTAQLAAESVDLREKVQARQGTATVFGAIGAGTN